MCIFCGCNGFFFPLSISITDRTPGKKTQKQCEEKRPILFCLGINVSQDSNSQKSFEQMYTLSVCPRSCCSNLKQPKFPNVFVEQPQLHWVCQKFLGGESPLVIADLWENYQSNIFLNNPAVVMQQVTIGCLDSLVSSLRAAQEGSNTFLTQAGTGAGYLTSSLNRLSRSRARRSCWRRRGRRARRRNPRPRLPSFSNWQFPTSGPTNPGLAMAKHNR